MRSPLAITAAVLLSALPLLQPETSRAQEAPVAYSAIRALNLARNTAVQSNGGLSVYRPAQCMYETASAGNQCLISSGSNGYTFRFLGGAPGWQQLNLAPTVETEIRISSDGRAVLGVDYNGAPR
jgi:type II secretory pathway pseudopilin PulG